MKLADYLNKSGFSKSALSKVLGVSRQAISKWDDIPTIWLDKIDGLVPEVIEKQKEWDEFSHEEATDLIKRRGGIEADPLRESETDHEIARSVGLKVWEFRRMIDRWVQVRLQEKKLSTEDRK